MPNFIYKYILIGAFIFALNFKQNFSTETKREELRGAVKGSKKNDIASKQKVLVIATTMLDGHFASMKHLTKALIKNGEKVHLLILNTGDVKEEKMKKLKVDMKQMKLMDKGYGKNSYEIFNFDANFVTKMNKGGEEDPLKMIGNKWKIRGTQQDKTILRNEAFLVYKEFLMSNEGHECMIDLRRSGFQSGLFDTWDFGAQWIFHLLDIERVFAFNKITLLTYQMKYADTLHNLVEKVPEVYATQVGDHDPQQNSERDFITEHNDNMKIFVDVHEEMDTWFTSNEEWKVLLAKFNWLKDDTKQMKISEIYKKNIKVFVESHPMLEWDLGAGKPKNLVYIGGIGVAKKYRNKIYSKKKWSNAKTTIISLKSMQDLVNNKDNWGGFNSMIQAFDELYKNNANAKFKFHFDCDSAEMEKHINKNAPNVPVTVKRIGNFTAKLAAADTRLLIANCSRGTVLEALSVGLPLICVPMSTDQFYTSEAILLPGKPHASTTLDLNEIMKGEKMGKQLVLDALEAMLIGNEATEYYLHNAHVLQQKLHDEWKEKSPEQLFIEHFHMK